MERLPAKIRYVHCSVVVTVMISALHNPFYPLSKYCTLQEKFLKYVLVTKIAHLVV